MWVETRRAEPLHVVRLPYPLDDLKSADRGHAVNRPFWSLHRGDGLRVFGQSTTLPDASLHGFVLAADGPEASSDAPAAIASAMRLFICSLPARFSITRPSTMSRSRLRSKPPLRSKSLAPRDRVLIQGA